MLLPIHPSQLSVYIPILEFSINSTASIKRDLFVSHDNKNVSFHFFYFLNYLLREYSVLANSNLCLISLKVHFKILLFPLKYHCESHLADRLQCLGHFSILSQLELSIKCCYELFCHSLHMGTFLICLPSVLLF